LLQKVQVGSVSGSQKARSQCCQAKEVDIEDRLRTEAREEKKIIDKILK